MDISKLKYRYTWSELADRLSICILKSIFLVDKKTEYEKEIADIMHDLDLLIEEGGIKISSKMIRALQLLGISNRFIWELESKARAGEGQDYTLLRTSHAINGIRTTAKNVISQELGERVDMKVDATSTLDVKNEKMDWTNLFFEI